MQEGEAGFSFYKYKGGDVFYDENCAATRMHGLNTDCLFLRPHADRNFTTMKSRQAVNQDATVVQAANALGIHRSMLYGKLRRHGLVDDATVNASEHQDQSQPESESATLVRTR